MRTSAPIFLLPVKPPARGKSRLRLVAPDVRRRLARAFALDTLAAIQQGVPEARVIVITTDADFSRTARTLEVETRPDPVPGNLNGTLSAVARQFAPDRFVVALCADLPALRGEELASGLTLAPRDGVGFVRDASGVGTTTYAAPARLFAPRFGVSSADAHQAAGAVEFGAHLRTLRADVDDAADLDAAIALGVGVHTSAVLGDS